MKKTIKFVLPNGNEISVEQGKCKFDFIIRGIPSNPNWIKKDKTDYFCEIGIFGDGFEFVLGSCPPFIGCYGGSVWPNGWPELFNDGAKMIGWTAAPTLTPLGIEIFTKALKEL